nr:hypothetical protein [uncultured Prevotella sp.]
MSRRRINLSVDDKLYNKLKHISLQFGFHNTCELSTSLLRLLCKYIETNEQEGISNRNEIEEMFRRYSDWEQTLTGVVPVKRHNKTLEDVK